MPLPPTSDDVRPGPPTGPREVYAAHFALREAPFSVTPDPRFFYVTPIIREAYATLVLGVTTLKGFTVLTGEPGTGKSTLIRRLVRDLEGRARFVVLTNPTVTFDELLAFACTELGLDASPSGRLAQLGALHRVLAEESRRGRTVVLVIDEAQHLDDHFLEQLRLLSNLESSTSKLLQIILVGQPELDATLERPELRQFKSRVALRARLGRLAPSDVEPYIDSRLRTAGCRRRDLFEVDAIDEVAACSQGLPRLVNVLCDNALLVAYGLGSPTVTREAVCEAARDLGLWQAPADAALRVRASRSTGARDHESPRSLDPVFVGVAALVVASVVAVAVVRSDAPLAAWWRTITERLAPADRGVPRPGAAVTPPSAEPASQPDMTPQAVERPEQPSPSAPARSIDPPVSARSMVVRPGTTIGQIAREVYGEASVLVLDVIHDFNPQLTDLDVVRAGQRLRLPALARETLLRLHPEGSYRFHFGSLPTLAEAERLARPVRGEGYEPEITRRTVTRTRSLYRVELRLADVEAADDAWNLALRRSWLPAEVAAALAARPIGPVERP